MARFTSPPLRSSDLQQVVSGRRRALREMIIVPKDALSEDALAGVVDAFILREGTDYGHREHTFEDKRRRVHTMLAQGTAQICYYPESEHIDIVLVE